MLGGNVFECGAEEERVLGKVRLLKGMEWPDRKWASVRGVEEWMDRRILLLKVEKRLKRMAKGYLGLESKGH